jgi:hypothetical protein
MLTARSVLAPNLNTPFTAFRHIIDAVPCALFEDAMFLIFLLQRHTLVLVLRLVNWVNGRQNYLQLSTADLQHFVIVQEQLEII